MPQSTWIERLRGATRKSAGIAPCSVVEGTHPNQGVEAIRYLPSIVKFAKEKIKVYWMERIAIFSLTLYSILGLNAVRVTKGEFLNAPNKITMKGIIIQKMIGVRVW
jgi:hypothetical protein